MSDYRRLRLPGATVFFTVTLAERGCSVLTDEVERLRYAVAATRRERPFTIDAFVVLPDHLHCVWTLPERDADFSVRWGAIKSRFTRSLRDGCRVGFNPTNALRSGRAVGWNPTLQRTQSNHAKGDAGIWQRRFWEHHIRDEGDYREHLAYCLNNPVKHGLVGAPEQWPFSSIHRDRAMGIAP